MTWHLPAGLAAQYARGETAVALTLSIEAHLMKCRPCREAVPYEMGWIEQSWAGIEDLIDRPRRGVAERVLTMVGVPGHVARLLVATPTLSRAWMAAVTVVLAFAVAAARLTEGIGESAQAGAVLPFLVAAPLLPVAGVALAYGRWADPVHESLAATPLAGVPLLLLRAGAALATAVALTGVATALFPASLGLTAAWLLPSLALTAGTLALSTWLPSVAAAALLGGAWVSALLLLNGQSLVFGPLAQILYGLAAPALALLAVFRHRRSEGYR
ncbi:zf-HC2 domain-containing protein [Streptosporangiaceae bacterium NEAU-GS5]|nr:zf-HC2 domain-containing protein [Streptosporangiaceae bacterium NEAU-GS5]